MPELPEVETIKRHLNNLLKDDYIIDVNVFYRKIVSNNLDFEKKLINQKIHEVKRYAKYLAFILDDYVLFSHLRMEGKYFYDEPHTKHTHVVFKLKSGHSLSYHDTRKFGRFELVAKKDAPMYLKTHKKLAEDPDDIQINDFYDRIKDRSKTIKELLLDQSVIGGIGNIYANEILYLSKIHPAKKGFLISLNEAKMLLKYSKSVLNDSIKMGGTTINTYESLGHKGLYQINLHVHGKKGETCSVCGSMIQKVALKGRGTYFCSVCQKSYIIGLTGGIASGKTTVSNYLKKKGFMVIDSDLIVKELYLDESFSLMIGQIFDSLKEGILDKKKLSKVIFNDINMRKKLESIIHPMVYQKIKQLVSVSFEHLIFLDIPLLFETNYKDFDQSLLIDTDESLQLERLIIRDHLSKKDANMRIASQMSLEKKRLLADVIIKNNESLSKLYESIDNYLKGFSL